MATISYSETRTFTVTAQNRNDAKYKALQLAPESDRRRWDYCDDDDVQAYDVTEIKPVK